MMKSTKGARIGEVDEKAYAQALIAFPPHPIHTDEDNARAISMLDALVSREKVSLEEKAVANVLLTLIKAYEERYAIAPSTPLQTLLELMAVNNIRRKDLAPEIASKGVISEILHGRRSISKGVAIKLAARFHVSHTLFL